MKKILITLGIILLVVLLISISMIYLPRTGTVVDAETGKPIEGAVVLVEWTKTKGFGLTYTESYKVAEMLTDKDGRVSLPGCYSPFVNAPDVTVYKKGYVAWNNKFVFPEYSKRNDFNWTNGYAFRLVHFQTGYSYDAHVSFVNTVISSTIAYEKKRMVLDSIDWETDIAREEVKKRVKK